MIRTRRTNLLGAILIWTALLIAPSVMVSHAIAASVHLDVVPLHGAVSTDGTDSDGSTGEPDAGQIRQPNQTVQTPTSHPSGIGWIEVTMWMWRSILVNAL